ncbi:Protein phosphatase 1G, partial [Perkinsus olseni]
RSTCEDIVAAYGNLRANTIPMVRSDLANSLAYFDSVWCRFEVHALEEIEVIHKQACGPLREAIEAEIDLSDAEDDSAVRRGSSYHRLVLGRVMDRLSELDDLLSPADSEESRTIFTPECLLEAEIILEKKPGGVEKQLCPILMKISKNLVSSFTGVRRLLRRYGQHMYQLNSHLANNRGLVVTLRRFYEAWVVAARYLSVQSHRKALVEAYGMVKAAQEDFPVEAMLALDPDFLMRLPHLLLYREMEATARSRSTSPLKRGKGGVPAASTGLPRMLSDQPMRQSEGSSKSPWQRSKICRLFLEESAADLFNTTALAFTSVSSAELHVVYERFVLPSASRTTGCSGIVEAPSEGLPGPCVEAPPSVVAMESLGKWDDAPVEEDGDTEEFSEKVRSRLSAVRELTSVPHASGDTLAGSNCKVLIHNMAELGLLMQRTRPLEWNRFVQVILQGIVSMSKSTQPKPSPAEAVRDVDTECADWGPLAVSVSSVQGWRRSMEDAHVAHWDAKKKIGIFGVFDGHGGQAVALYVAKHLVPILTDREAYRQGKYERALHETFMELDRLMITEKGKKEVAMLDKEAQGACPDPILRLPVNTVKRDLLALIGEDSSDEDMEDSDDSDDDSEGEVEEAGDGDMKDAEPPSAGQAECRRSTRIAASKKQGRKKDKKQVAIDGLLFLLQFLIPKLPKDIKSRVTCTDDGFLELRQSTLNDIIGRDSTPEGQGCTAVVCLVALGDDEEYPRLICANAGDSRCMVVRDGKAYDLSEDHKPSQPVERERITQAGGVIEQCEGGDRVQGDLNLSRSLGDHRYKKDKKLYPECQIISGMPDIRVRALTGKDTHIILGCDGVWEVHTNAGAAEKVVEFEQRLGKGSLAGSEVPQPKSNTVHTIDGSVEDKVTESLSKITAAMCSSSVRDSLVPTEPSGECEGTDNVTFMLVKIAPAVREELKPLPVEIEEKEENPSPATPIVFGRGPGTKTACEAAMKVMRGKRKRRDGKHKKKNRRELLLAEVMAQINTLPKVPGRIGKLISRMGIRRHKYLDHFDQAPEMSVLRREKDKHARDTMLTKQQIGSLFGEEERNALLESKRDVRKLAAEKEQVLRSTVNEGLRVYRALRPDALPFYQEDAVLSMKAKMNRLNMMESGRGVAPNQTGAVLPRDKLQLKNEVVDPFQFQLPVVNPKAFLIALEAACRSLCDDLEYIASCLGIKAEELPAQDDPLRFQRLVESVMFAFPLRKDPEYVDEFMFNHWPKLKQLMPPAIAELPDTDVADWLRGHLQRVIHNQKEHRKIWLHKAPKK